MPVVRLAGAGPRRGARPEILRCIDSTMSVTPTIASTTSRVVPRRSADGSGEEVRWPEAGPEGGGSGATRGCDTRREERAYTGGHQWCIRVLQRKRKVSYP